MPTLITRADDLGSGSGANIAIAQALEGEFIKNVSCMAVGPMIEQGAELVRGSRNCCFGLHAVLNAEWDRIKWLPLAPPERIPSLLTDKGVFPASPEWFLTHPPAMEEILHEFDCQLDLLTRLRIPVSYVDLHMMPDRQIPGLRTELSAWAARKGLIDHSRYYRTPEKPEPAQTETAERGYREWASWLDCLEEGQYFVVTHPNRYSRESLLMGNAGVPQEYVARCRDTEYRLLRTKALDALCAERGIVTLRYDEAVPPAGNENSF